jgi:hypothetical protein
MIEDSATKIRHQHNHVPRLRAQQPGHGPLQSNKSSNEQGRPRIRAKQRFDLGIPFEKVFTALGMDLLRLFVDEEGIHCACAPFFWLGIVQHIIPQRTRNAITPLGRFHMGKQRV